MPRIGIIQVKYASDTVADRCPMCNKISELEIILYQGAFVIGLPLFPTSKKHSITCTSCKNSISMDSAPNFALDKYDTMITSKKPSIWIYSFSYFAGVMMIWFTIHISINNAKFKKYIDDPRIGDVYETKTKKSRLFGDENYYSYMKIVSLSDDTIGFKLCPLEATASKRSEIKNKPEEEKWSDEIVFYTKEDLKQKVESISNLDQNFVIDDIER